MSSHLPDSQYFGEEDLPLIQVSHAYVQAMIWFKRGMHNKITTFDLFVREMPDNRNYMIAGGLEEILVWLQKIKFSEDDIHYLKECKLIDDAFGEYLRNFKFTGTVHAMPEGTVFFPYEPVIRITAPIIEASLIETFIMSAFVSHTIFTSKAARIITAAKKKFEVGTGVIRAHSFESGIKANRAAYICGMITHSNPSFVRKYKMPIPTFVVNGQHLFIKSFPDEISAFRAIAEDYPENCAFMIDTYDVKRGLEDAITVAKELKTRGGFLTAVTIDSGDLISQTKYVRERLDEEGLQNVKIYLVSNIDEKMVEEFVKTETPVDAAYSVTQFVTVLDSPKLEAVYKLAEVREGEKITNTAKLSHGKLSYPGRKQVFRIFKDGKMAGDTIGLEDENFGESLLVKVIDGGKLIYELPDLQTIKKYVATELSQLPKELLNLHKFVKYPVEISKRIKEILARLKDIHSPKSHF